MSESIWEKMCWYTWNYNVGSLARKRYAHWTGTFLEVITEKQILDMDSKRVNMKGN